MVHNNDGSFSFPEEGEQRTVEELFREFNKDRMEVYKLLIRMWNDMAWNRPYDPARYPEIEVRNKSPE